MANRRRDLSILLKVTPEEKKLIRARSEYFGFTSVQAYLLKTAIDVTVVNVNTDGLNKTATEISRIGNNINQIARLCNEKKNATQSDVDRLLQYMENVVEVVNKGFDTMTVLKNQTEVESK